MINNISKNDLYIAYKKAKYELYHDEKSLCLEELYTYESDLEININNLYEQLQNKKFDEIKLGISIEITKSYETTEIQGSHFSSNSLKHHQSAVESMKNCEIKMRKLLLGTIDFHILSALWINKIGQFIDSKFSDDIYGSRLQTLDENTFCNKKHSYNLNSPRIFKPYQTNYQKWRNNSFKIVEENHSKSSIIVMTMDISGFFDTVNLEEFTTQEFYNRFELNKLEDWKGYLKEFHEEFISLIRRYNSENKTIGLPIGLTASHILANSVLKQFDDDIATNFRPLYYGRYVDDILFVFNECGSIQNSADVIKFILSKIPSLKSDLRNRKKELTYSAQSQNLIFKQEKQKIFYFDKNADLMLLDSIKKEILSVSSEWMLVPNLLDDDSSLLKKIIGVKSESSEFDDAFRKIESITIKRLGLALLISHSNMINNYLEPKIWSDKRATIYDIIENHLFIPKNFIEHSMFLIRTFKLMNNSHDGERVLCFLQKINEMLTLFSSSKCDLKSFKEYLSKSFYEALISTLDINNTIEEIIIEQIIIEIKKIADNINYLNTKSEIVEKNSLMFFKDLTYRSYANEITQYISDKDSNSLLKNLITNSKNDSEIEWITNKEILIYTTFETELKKNWNYHEIKAFNYEIIKLCDDKLNVFENKDFFDLSALLFPTRMFNSLDLSNIINPEKEIFNDTLSALRGTTSKSQVSINSDEKDKVKTLNIKHSRNNQNPKIAIANIKLSDRYFYASVKNKPILSKERFKEISQVINEALKKDIDYLVLPELSVPRKWAILFAKRLLTKNISLITGVEYLHEDNSLRNSIYHFLISDDVGFNHIKLFRQDKSIPAHSERENIRKLMGKELTANKKFEEKYIYNHNDFCFSTLICNEFTDIENRSRLRGKVDAVIIVEWNTDIKYFNALIESASFDIHCYTVQVNNRKYGDSRIRAPFKEEYDRDVVKIKGGIYNHIVAGQVEIEKLREFQSNHISVSKEFKPVPTGFEISKIREKF